MSHSDASTTVYISAYIHLTVYIQVKPQKLWLGIENCVCYEDHHRYSNILTEKSV